MKKQHKIIWKFYAIIFSLMALANLTWLLYAQSEPFIFYHTLIAWSKFYWIHYTLAVLKSGIALVCLATLYGFAFNRISRHTKFWQWMLVARIVSDIVGNFYEFLFIKSAFHMVPGYGLSVTGALLLPVIPSYIAHFLYAFNPKK